MLYSFQKPCGNKNESEIRFAYYDLDATRDRRYSIKLSPAAVIDEVTFIKCCEREICEYCKRYILDKHIPLDEKNNSGAAGYLRAIMLFYGLSVKIQELDVDLEKASYIPQNHPEPDVLLVTVDV